MANYLIITILYFTTLLGVDHSTWSAIANVGIVDKVIGTDDPDFIPGKEIDAIQLTNEFHGLQNVECLQSRRSPSHRYFWTISTSDRFSVHPAITNLKSSSTRSMTLNQYIAIHLKNVNANISLLQKTGLPDGRPDYALGHWHSSPQHLRQLFLHQHRCCGQRNQTWSSLIVMWTRAATYGQKSQTIDIGLR